MTAISLPSLRTKRAVEAAVGLTRRQLLPVQAAGDVTATWAGTTFETPSDGVVVQYDSALGVCLAADYADRGTILLDESFDDATQWTAGTGLTISEGACVGATATADVSQASRLVIGETYLVVFGLTATAGTVTPYCGTTAGTARGSGGVEDKVYAEVIVAAGSTTFKLAGAGFTGSIPFVAAIPVGPFTPNGLRIPDSFSRIAAAIASGAIVALSSAGEGVWPLWLRD
jgi:hypothetical protein